jgi:hypothetical protein
MLSDERLDHAYVFVVGQRVDRMLRVVSRPQCVRFCCHRIVFDVHDVSIGPVREEPLQFVDLLNHTRQAIRDTLVQHSEEDAPHGNMHLRLIEHVF